MDERLTWEGGKRTGWAWGRGGLLLTDLSQTTSRLLHLPLCLCFQLMKPLFVLFFVISSFGSFSFVFMSLFVSFLSPHLSVQSWTTSGKKEGTLCSPVYSSPPPVWVSSHRSVLFWLVPHFLPPAVWLSSYSFNISWPIHYFLLATVRLLSHNFNISWPILHFLPPAVWLLSPSYILFFFTYLLSELVLQSFIFSLPSFLIQGKFSSAACGLWFDRFALRSFSGSTLAAILLLPSLFRCLTIQAGISCTMLTLFSCSGSPVEGFQAHLSPEKQRQRIDRCFLASLLICSFFFPCL